MLQWWGEQRTGSWAALTDNQWRRPIRASDVGAGGRVGTCLLGPLGMPVLLCGVGGGLCGGGAGVPLASHEGEHTKSNEG